MIRILLENQAQRIEGVSGRAFGPGLAFITRCGAGHTGFADIRGPRQLYGVERDATRPRC